jgi:hypothetical protein
MELLHMIVRTTIAAEAPDFHLKIGKVTKRKLEPDYWRIVEALRRTSGGMNRVK